MLRSAALAFAVTLVAANGASAEVVARGVEDGSLALDGRGTPSVAYVRGSSLVVASRSTRNRWSSARAATVPVGSSVTAFRVGAAGPVALVQGADARTLVLVRRRSVGWQTIRLAARLPALMRLGRAGLALDARGLPTVGYARWNGATLDSWLVVARVDAKGRVSTRPITSEGFPTSLVPPPAAVVMVGGRAHVIESYGYRDVLTTLEWFPQGKTWLGLGLDAGLGDFPVGPVFAGVSPNGVLHAAWTESLTYFNSVPVTLVARRKNPSSRFVLDRALTTGLALPSSGPEVAANEWVGSDEVGLPRADYAWAGTIVRGKSRVELDGWLAGLAVAPRGRRDVLLGGPEGLRWFRSPRRLSTRVTLAATEQGPAVALAGRVRGAARGKVSLYRERPGSRRKPIGSAALSNGAFSFSDRTAARGFFYRAVYVDPTSGIPYATLLRNPS